MTVDALHINSDSRDIANSIAFTAEGETTEKEVAVAAATTSSWPFSMMVASAVASTDPIAVLSILEEMDAPSQFGAIFDCESLINDGSSIFLFDFFKAITRGDASNWKEATAQFFRLLVIGPVFGYLVAALVLRWLKTYSWYPYDATLALVFFGYLVFFVAEIYIKTSGPLAVVVFGVYFKANSKATFDSETVTVHKHFVRGCATACTSVVFIISGIASTRMMWDALSSSETLQLPDEIPELELESAGEVLQLSPLERRLAASATSLEIWRVTIFYVYMLIARFFMVGLFYPLIRRGLGQFGWKQYLLVSWGGLRGAVCLILAFTVEYDERFAMDLTSTASLYIASAAFLILVINGLSFEFLYKKLNPYAPNPFRKVYMDKVMRLVERQYVSEIPYINQHWLFEHYNMIACADKLVPRLNEVRLDKQGRIVLDAPNVNKTLELISTAKLSGVWAGLAEAVQVKEDDDVPSQSATSSSVISSSSSKRKLYRRMATRGEGDVATIQRLRPGAKAATDIGWKEALELVEGTDETQKEDAALLEDRDALLNVGATPDLVLPVIEEGDGSQSSETGGQKRRSTMPDVLALPVITKPSSSLNPYGVDSTPLKNQGSPGKDSTGRSVKWNDTTPPTNLAQPFSTLSKPLGRVDSLVQPASSPQTQPQPQSPRRGSETSLLMAAYTYRANKGDGSNVHNSAVKIPGYRYDSIGHMRSDPYGAGLDAAVLEKIEKVLADRGLSNQADELPIPRARTEPKIGQLDKPLIPPAFQHLSSDIRQRDKDGEILVMMVNTMRQLYHNLYVQSFISGKVLSDLLSIGDVVIDFAFLDVDKKTKSRKWRSRFMTSNNSEQDAQRKSTQTPVQLAELTSKDIAGFLGSENPLKEGKVDYLLEHYTGFDIEWELLTHQLRGGQATKQFKLRKLLHKLCCRPPPIAHQQAPRRHRNWRPEKRWKYLLRKVLIQSCSWLRVRSTFRSLDDLQMICAYVDVHKEQMSRGEETLESVIGPKMLAAFEAKIQAGQDLVLQEFPRRYPDTFPYALVCHAAIFLLNFKIQLIEEQYAKGLLMEADKEKICDVLRRQLYKVARYHPPFLFG
eukprot:Blabericola_migrator_1__2892@NODE_1830_length_3728_cov_110_996995_g1172_i0_p1_GENE_NODE_1830_length_3728_cov_110_996995_g1172_i0NODE_1830_length_3728_cov_110_996995_g1172_i0_p1_ORF_typecomplete_len1209_score175_15Na_H_Exchanger/PF00999_21/2_8e08Na_H_Exchanger/PF00999_21/5_2e38Cation_efflux/PF01545_21/0_095Cation_efflux/PF01545_21/2e03Cation_efflux/PF01545_21/1e04Ctr/PF04145_15/4_8e03Ctr/PF04145_15/1_7_NODE_1830_length_3728_cov_110_996995_g1172_i03743628